MGTDCPADAGAASFGPAKGGGLAQRSAGDPLHFVQRMSVAGTAEGISPIFDGSGLFLCWARYRKGAENRHSAGPASPPEARAQAQTNGSGHLQPERADDPG